MLYGDHLPLLEQLSRLSSPTEGLIRPVWGNTPVAQRYMYGVTNLGPLIWTAVGLRNIRDAERHIELAEALGRRVLIVATERVPLFDGIDEVEPFELPPDEPLEAIGASALWEFMSNI